MAESKARCDLPFPTAWGVNFFLTLLAITLIKSFFFFLNVYVSGSLDFSNKVVLCRMCIWGMLFVCTNLVSSMVCDLMGEMGTFCLVWSPLDLGYFYSLVAVEEIEEKTWPGLLERAAERLTLGCLFTLPSSPHFRTAGVPGSALQSCLDSLCWGLTAHLSSWFILPAWSPG